MTNAMKRWLLTEQKAVTEGFEAGILDSGDSDPKSGI